MDQEEFDIHNSAVERDGDYERALRPGRFEAFAGQEKIVENLRIFVQAARMRGEPLDHLLLHGPPGLGKTTLSAIIANELGVAQAVDFVDEKHVVLLKRRKDSGQIARLVEHRPRSNLETHT